MTQTHISRIRAVCATFMFGALFLCGIPHITHADLATTTTTQSALTAAIRSAITSDPRAAGLAPSQLNAMVQSLTQSAQSQGVTATDIVVPPAQGNTEAGGANGDYQSSGTCSTGTPSFICNLVTAFGFDGNNLIPLWLGGTAALLILIIGTILELRHLAHIKEQEAQQIQANAQ